MNYFNSTFKIRPRDEAKTSLPYRQRIARLRRRGRLNANGRRTKDWRKVWRFLKPEFEKRGRKWCEFDFIPHTCFGILTPAHSKKRRLMEGNDIYAVALACAHVHRMLDEDMSHVQMEAAVMFAIDRSGGLVLPEEK